MNHKKTTKLLKVGAFVGGLLFVVMIMIASIGKETALFAQKAVLRARVANAANLKPGSFVELKGLRIGTVRDVAIASSDEVEITFTVLESELKWVKRDSSVTVATAGLVGDKFLEVKGGSPDAPMVNPETDVLRSSGTEGFQQIVETGEDIAAQVTTVLGRLDRILADLEENGKLSKLAASVSQSSSNLASITTELRRSKLGESLEKFNRASGSLEQILGRIQNGPGTMNSLIFDDSLHENLRALFGGAQRNKVIKYFIRESIKDSERKKP